MVALVATVGKCQQTERQTERITCETWRHDESQTKHTEHTKIARVERHEKWDIHNERKGESKINKIESYVDYVSPRLAAQRDTLPVNTRRVAAEIY